jgi:hypothetical protein
MDPLEQIFARIPVGMGDILAVGKEGLQSLAVAAAPAAVFENLEGLALGY